MSFDGPWNRPPGEPRDDAGRRGVAPDLAPPDRRRQTRVTIAFVVLIAALTLVNVLLPFGSGRGVIPYSQFLRLVDQGRVQSVSISSADVTGIYHPANGQQLFD